jgi:hypothetical protein
MVTCRRRRFSPAVAGRPSHDAKSAAVSPGAPPSVSAMIATSTYGSLRQAASQSISHSRSPSNRTLCGLGSLWLET